MSVVDQALETIGTSQLARIGQDLNEHLAHGTPHDVLKLRLSKNLGAALVTGNSEGRVVPADQMARFDLATRIAAQPALMNEFVLRATVAAFEAAAFAAVDVSGEA